MTRHRRRRRRTAPPARAGRPVLLALLLAAAAHSAPAQTLDDDWKVERLESSWPVLESTAVTVENPRGSLWVRTHDRPEVYVLAHVQRHSDDPRELDLGLRRTDEAIVFEVDFTEAGAEVAVQPAAWAKRRIDLTVFVPPAAPARFATDTGSLEVRGTRGPVDVETRTGNVRLRVHGAVTARTENGDVLAQFLDTRWGRPSEIATTTGEIRVEIPTGGGAEVVVETRGEITSDYSTELERLEGSLLKRARLTAGDGGDGLRLTSHQGPIKVLQSLVTADDDGD